MQRSPGAGGFQDRRIGGRIVVPGWPQWSWGQRQRAAALLGTFGAAAGVGLFAWGSPMGLALLAVAFGMHVASAADALRQQAFPGFGPLVPWAWSSAALGGVAYAPAFGVALAVAWPVARPEAPQAGFLVNRWAFREAEPTPGAWLWCDGPGGPGVARALAGPGARVEWRGGRLDVDGAEIPLPWTAGLAPDRLALEVPPDHVLVLTSPRPGSPTPSWLLLHRDRILGRAWAQHAPLWDRRLLFDSTPLLPGQPEATDSAR